MASNSMVFKEFPFPDLFPEVEINNLRAFFLEIAKYLTIYPSYVIIYPESEKLRRTPWRSTIFLKIFSKIL